LIYSTFFENKWSNFTIFVNRITIKSEGAN
jgi:hypothetical protein